MELNEIYSRVTTNFAKRINSLFESEDTLKEFFMQYLAHLPFDRTNHWGGLLYLLFRDVWHEHGPEVKADPTWYDRAMVLRELHSALDYNLFTQVFLNLQQTHAMSYRTADAEGEIKRLQEGWPKEAKLQPFAPKAKMVKAAATEEEHAYNLAISVVRSLKIIAAWTPQVSFRVSPKGSTPALADSNNISTLGVGSDKYLKVMPGLRAFYITWPMGAAPTMAVSFRSGDGETGFQATGIPYPFKSESGGDILQQALFARRIAWEVFGEYDIVSETCILVPRMSSVLVVADEKGVGVKNAFYRLNKQVGIMELFEGVRA